MTVMHEHDKKPAARETFRNITEHFWRIVPWWPLDRQQYLAKHEEWPDDVSYGDPGCGRLTDETRGHIRGRAADAGRHAEKADDADVWRDLMPAKLWLTPRYSEKGETGPYAPGSDNGPVKGQADGQSPEGSPGYVHVQDYDRHQAGKIVHVRDYDRRHTTSEHGEEHRVAEAEQATPGAENDAAYEAERKQGHDEFKKWLLHRRLQPTSPIGDPEFRKQHPAYMHGVEDCINELMDTKKDFRDGFWDGRGGNQNYGKGNRYYMEGLLLGLGALEAERQKKQNQSWLDKAKDAAGSLRDLIVPAPIDPGSPTGPPRELTPLHGKETLEKRTLDYWRKQCGVSI